MSGDAQAPVDAQLLSDGQLSQGAQLLPDAQLPCVGGTQVHVLPSVQPPKRPQASS